MKEEFVPFKLAKKLRKLGFNEPCFGKYDINGELYYYYDHQNSNIQNYVIACSAPLYQQAFKWLYNQLGTSGLMLLNEKYRYKALKDLIKKVKNGTSDSAF